eukprot:1362919-Rhodomonas_salina.2
MARAPKGVFHGRYGPCQDVTARPHRAADQYGLPDPAVQFWDISVTRRKGACGPLPVDQQAHLTSGNRVQLFLGDVVRDVVHRVHREVHAWVEPEHGRERRPRPFS